ncbi:MAG: ribosome-associated translation inhibitor RaiA [Anaerolineales bacterium]|nr:ribosome-associated translation inhibitor RaiA [Anaerolineales bacterium]MCW5854803.1 ribosome-associated translation inhibitor RaiA [Anaerolineales bacterium]
MTTVVDISAKDFQVDDTLRDYVSSRAEKLDRYLPDVEDVKVDLAHRKAAKAAGDRYKAQITLRGASFVLRAEENSDQPSNAFDLALEKIQRQMERYKGKRQGNKSAQPVLADQELAEFEIEDEPLSEIVRQKRFLLHPMSPAEAMEQMRLLGHNNFFVFYNMDANGVSVLYRRGDDSYGLIDTEIA